MNKALFWISSLWLWHATRTLVIINYYLDKWYEIDIISFWNTLNYLKIELNWKKINFIELEDYPLLERWNGIKFYYYLIQDLIKTNITIRKEKKFIKNIDNKYDFIFSDGRYWLYSKEIPCFLLTHQLSFIMPKRLWLFKLISDLFNYWNFKRFTFIFIPDYENINESLAWKLSHPIRINKINHKYIWILSSFNNNTNDEEIDYLFSISWYLLDEKKKFIDRLINEAKTLSGKKVFILWDTSEKYIKNIENNITIYSFVNWEEREKLFLKSKIIISRTWYTTIMDLAELWKKAILFPTQNQTEQEYLARYLNENKLYVIWSEESELNNLVSKLDNSNIYNPIHKSQKSIIEIDNIINKYL